MAVQGVAHCRVANRSRRCCIFIVGPGQLLPMCSRSEAVAPHHLDEGNRAEWCDQAQASVLGSQDLGSD